MSLAELKSELKKLTPAEIAEIEAALQQMKTGDDVGGRPLSEFFGCARGMMIFHPGWDEDEPLGMWEALRDDAPL